MTGVWTEHAAERVRDAWLARAGLAGHITKRISFRQNAIWLVPGLDISIRVYGPGEDQSRADLMVRCARWLERHDFPAVRLADLEPRQPVDILGHRVSIWRWIDATPPAADSAAAFGRLLRRFHDLPPDAGLQAPAFDQIARIRQRLDRLRAARAIPEEGLRLLDGLRDRAEAAADVLRGVGRGTFTLRTAMP